jgi:acetyl-CoA acetyltransferase
MLRRVVVVDGCRIPFTLAGTAYKELLAVDLGRLVLKGLIAKVRNKCFISYTTTFT